MASLYAQILKNVAQVDVVALEVLIAVPTPLGKLKRERRYHRR